MWTVAGHPGVDQEFGACQRCGSKSLTRPGQARQHVLQVGIGVMPVHARRLHQAHHRGRALARAQASGEQVENPWALQRRQG